MNFVITLFLVASTTVLYATQPRSIIYAPAYTNISHNAPFFPSIPKSFTVNDNYLVFSSVEPATCYFSLNNLQACRLLPIALSNEIAQAKPIQEAFTSAFQQISAKAPEEYGYFAEAFIFDSFKNNLYLHYGHIGSLKTIIVTKKKQKTKLLSLTQSTQTITDLPLEKDNTTPRAMRIIDEIIPYITHFDQGYNQSFYKRIEKRHFYLENAGHLLSHTHCLGSFYQKHLVNDTCSYRFFENPLTPHTHFMLIGSSQFWHHIKEDAAAEYINYWLNQQQEINCAIVQEIAQNLINHVDNCVQKVLERQKSMFVMLIVFNWSSEDINDL